MNTHTYWDLEQLFSHYYSTATDYDSNSLFWEECSEFCSTVANQSTLYRIILNQCLDEMICTQKMRRDLYCSLSVKCSKNYERVGQIQRLVSQNDAVFFFQYIQLFICFYQKFTKTWGSFWLCRLVEPFLVRVIHNMLDRSRLSVNTCCISWSNCDFIH